MPPSLRLCLFITSVLLLPLPGISGQIDIHGPTGSDAFGGQVTVLPNGNIVVIDVGYSIPGGAAEVGAVYLYSPTGALISTITGSTADDEIGSGGIAILSDESYLIRSQRWHYQGAKYAGAVTWASATTGVSGVVSPENSLVGTHEYDWVGEKINSFDSIVPLSNGNYLVRSPHWHNGAATDAGAVTWGSGATGVSGVISATNSLVGSKTNDSVGETDLTLLNNGNYVIASPKWDSGSSFDAGAVTWGDGDTGVFGEITSSNSFIGKGGDELGGTWNDESSVAALSSGDYVICSPMCWNREAPFLALYAGAVTWCDGDTGRTGVVSNANSLMGTHGTDYVGEGGIKELEDGHFIVISYSWNKSDSALGVGAVTWCADGAAAVGEVSTANSITGSKTGDSVGSHVTVLANGNYVVGSRGWDNGMVVNAGAVTWCNGATGTVGTVSPENSLVGSAEFDEVGDVTALANGHYVVSTWEWDNGVIEDVGAVTWCDGTVGLAGVVSTANSLVGSQEYDKVGRILLPLTNGNYVVDSSDWNRGIVPNVGAFTWCKGTEPTVAAVSVDNSLVGTKTADNVGTVFALSNGNYVVANRGWDNGSVVDAGAVTWGSGTAGISGVISAANSLVGSRTEDYVGHAIVPLQNGHYVVCSPHWSTTGQYGAINHAGAVTWANGATGISGPVSVNNSLVGGSAIDNVGAVEELPDGNFLVLSQAWDNTEDESTPAATDAGAVTWCSGSAGLTGKVTSQNSLVGVKDLRLAAGTIGMNEDGSYVVAGGHTALFGAPVPPIRSALSLSLPGVGLVGVQKAGNSLIDTEDTGYAHDYDPSRRQLAVGRYGINIVTLLRAAVLPPTVVSSTVNLPANTNSITITGTNFSTLPGDISVTLSGAATGVITSVTSTQIILSSVTGLTGGPLIVRVTSGGSQSAEVRVGTVVPIITSSTANISAGTNTLILHGFGFSTVLGNNVVSLNGGLKGTVIAATSTQLTLSLSGAFVGNINASVTVNGTGSGNAVQVATMIPTVTPRAVNVALDAPSLIIYGYGFSTTPSSNTVVFGNGVTGQVTAATATRLTITNLLGLTQGAITAIVKVGDFESGPAVQVATGIPPASGTIAFDSAVYKVNLGADNVEITLVRAGSDTATSVTITTGGAAQPGFSPAVAGADFVALTGPDTTVDFAQGQLSQTVIIDLLGSAGVSRPNKIFSVNLSAPVAGASLGLISTATVLMVSDDHAMPTVTITAPVAAPTMISALAPYWVKGVAGDPRGIDHVEIVHNSLPAVRATLGATKTTSVPYSALITPVTGANTLAVTAYDMSGNSKTITRNFNFTRRYTFSLARVAPAGVAQLDKVGTVTLASTPAASASALIPTTAHYNPRTSAAVPGASLKLTATPKTGYVFSHWTGQPDNAGSVAVGNVITFVMPYADITVTANFVANPFGADGGGTGFFGLIHAESGTPVDNGSEGCLTGTLTATTGAFTGKLLMDGASTPITATFYGNGSAIFTSKAGRQPFLNFGSRTLTLVYNAGLGNNQITATVAGVLDSMSSGAALRSHYSTARKVPSTLLNTPTSTKGLYTFALPAKVQSPTLDPALYPQGSGFGSLSLSNLGIVTFTGFLADGASLTGTFSLAAGNVCPVFFQLPTPGAAATVKGGSFGGTLAFDRTPADSDVTAADLLWIRPTVTEKTTPPAAAAATRLYTAGWPNGLRVDLVGALYNTTAKVQATLLLPNVTPASAVATTSNAELLFTGGRLSPSIPISTFNILANTVTKIPKTDPAYTLTLAPASGAFSGTFTPNWPNPATTKPAFKGILLQKGGSIGGYGYFLGNAPLETNPESGSVTLGAIITSAP